jgi:histidinol-phosphatase
VSRVPLADDLALAHALADAADRVTTARFRAHDLTVETKPDLTPVTDADRAVELLVRERLAAARPRDMVLGEEYGGAAAAGRQWVVDPVDGTKNFVRGNPVWATLIALRDNGEVTCGLVSAPALGRRWWAARGAGSWVRDPLHEARACEVSRVQRLSDAFLSYSGSGGWEGKGDLTGLARSCWRTRAFGDFWSYCLVAEGAADIACEPEVSLWDLAAVQVIVEEAGGCFTDLTGRRGHAGGSAVASNGLLHDAALRALAVS